MYRLIFVLFILSSCKTGVKQQILANKTTHETLVDDKMVNDTDLISVEATKETYYVVYIEHNRQSAIYKGVLNFEPDSIEKNEYEANYKQLRRLIPSSFKKFDLTDLPKEWMPIYLYKGKYYIYAPSEWGNLNRRIITDSTMVYWLMDGLTPFPIMAVNKNKKDVYNFKIHSTYDSTVKQFTIHIIDPKNKIAIWEDIYKTEQNHYSLFIPRENAQNFDMIVSYCKQHKTGEFTFDKIDYASLLKGHYH
jgi:hypothetical protein